MRCIGMGVASMTDYKKSLIELLDRLSEKSIKRIYELAKYLYVYKEEGGAE